MPDDQDSLSWDRRVVCSPRSQSSLHWSHGEFDGHTALQAPRLSPPDKEQVMRTPSIEL